MERSLLDQNIVSNEEDLLTHEVSDETLEAAGGMKQGILAFRPARIISGARAKQPSIQRPYARQGCLHFRFFKADIRFCDAHICFRGEADMTFCGANVCF
jgi:hypothetical protein